MNSTVKVVARRAAVTVGVVGSLGLGAAAIDAAAQWTASAAPLQAPPVSAESLAAQLANEQARGTDLETRLQAAISQTSQLQAALDAAKGRIAADDGTARTLRAQVADSQRRLAALNKQAAAAGAALQVDVARQAAAARQAALARPAGTRPPAATAQPTAAATSSVVSAASTPAPIAHATTGASGTPAPGEGGDD
jgi:hypothetical protein